MLEERADLRLVACLHCTPEGKVEWCCNAAMLSCNVELALEGVEDGFPWILDASLLVRCLLPLVPQLVQTPTPFPIDNAVL